MDAPAQTTVAVRLQVNGTPVCHQVEPRVHLVDFLRQHLGLTGSRLGCEHGVCGACTVQLNGEIVRGCLTLAVQAEGAEVWTIEGLAESGALRTLQRTFHARNAAQCGFCTSGMLLTAHDYVRTAPANPSRECIRKQISGNICRCTGYQAIVDAVEDACREEKEGAQ